MVLPMGARGRFSWVWIIVSVVFFAAGIWLIVYYLLQPSGPVRKHAEVNEWVHCDNCNKDFAMLVVYSPKNPIPYKCPRCGKRAVYPYRRCWKCKTLFLVRPASPGKAGPRGGSAGGVRCPYCGSSEVGGLMPQEVEALAAGKKISFERPGWAK